MKTIYLGADHAGFDLKEKLKRWLITKKIPFNDLGNLRYDPADDYPDYAVKVARRVVAVESKGIVVCGSAQGVCIAANKIKGVRAVIPVTVEEARLSREHNDANVLCLSGWNRSFALTIKLVEAFLKTAFSTEARHIRRVDKIRKLEKRGYDLKNPLNRG